MQKTGLFRVLLLFVSLLFITGACTQAPLHTQSSANASTEEESARTTLRFISSWGGVDSKAESLKTILNQFVKSNPDIEIINESLFGEDFLPKIKTDFASGNDPDVFGLWPGTDINQLVNAGKVADLTGLLMDNLEWKRSFNPHMWGYTTHNAKIYGLPVEVIFECLFVNKDLFQKYNLKIPETYEELKTAIAVFNENKIIPIAFNTYAEGTYLYQNLIAVIGGRDDTEFPFVEGSIKPSHISALQYIKNLYDMDAFPDDCFTLTNNERNVLFKTKKAAMIVQGSWFIGEFAPDDMTVDIIPFPALEGYESRNGTMVYGLGGGSFHMSAAAANGDVKRREASIRLLKALTSPETAAFFASETGMLSNVNIDRYHIQYRRLAIKGQQLVERAPVLAGPLDSYVERTCWEEDIAGQFPYFLSGKITAEEMWGKAIEHGIIPK